VEQISLDTNNANIILNHCLLKLREDEKLSSYFTINDIKYFLPLIKELLSSKEKEQVESTILVLRDILSHYGTSLKPGGTNNDVLSALKRLNIPWSSLTGNTALIAKEISKHIQAM